MAEYRWFTLTSGDKSLKLKRIPKWAKQVAVDQDGTVWLPSAVIGSPMIAFLCASYDGTPALLVGERAYYPAEWMKREFPETATAVNGAIALIKAATDA
jgi:hypothetical protein